MVSDYKNPFTSSGSVSENLDTQVDLSTLSRKEVEQLVQDLHVQLRNVKEQNSEPHSAQEKATRMSDVFQYLYENAPISGEGGGGTHCCRGEGLAATDDGCHATHLAGALLDDLVNVHVLSVVVCSRRVQFCCVH